MRHHGLDAGEYFFDHPVNAFQVFDMLAEGRVYVRELLVPEGYSMFDIADLVAQQVSPLARIFWPRLRIPRRSAILRLMLTAWRAFCFRHIRVPSSSKRPADDGYDGEAISPGMDGHRSGAIAVK